MDASKKRILIIVVSAGMIIAAALGFFVFDFSTTERKTTTPPVMIDTSCPVQPCIKKAPEVTKPCTDCKDEIKKKKVTPKPEKPWNPFRNPWETG